MLTKRISGAQTHFRIFQNAGERESVVAEPIFNFLRMLAKHIFEFLRMLTKQSRGTHIVEFLRMLAKYIFEFLRVLTKGN